MQTTQSKAPNGVDASGTRAYNRRLLLSTVKARGPLSRTDLVRSTTLAKATVSVIIDELVSDGLVLEIGVGQSPSQGGRPPILLAYNDRAELLVGVHVGVQRTTVVLATGTGIEIARQSAATPRASAESALAAAAVLILKALKKGEGSLEEVVSIGMCLPGLTDPRRGVCVLAPNLGWRDVPVADLLSSHLDPAPPVRVQNTAQAVALAENLEGAGKGVRDMLLVYVGTGVGAAIMYEGEIAAGVDGLAGEIGHIAVPGSTRQCGCGKIGCLETMVSAQGIVESVRAELAAGATSSVSDARPLTSEAIGAAALEGDPVCMRAIAMSGRELGRVMSWAIMLLNPSVVVVAGGVSTTGDLLMRPIRQAVKEGTLADSLGAVDIRLASLGQEDKIRGAVLTAMRAWDNATAPVLGSAV